MKLDEIFESLSLGDNIILFNYVIIASIMFGLIASIGSIENVKAFVMGLFVVVILALINNVLLTIKNYK